jgi:hypothetical protein
MNQMKIDTVTDDNGALRIQIPGRRSRYKVHVTVEWKEVPVDEARDWPEGWLESVPGSIDDPTFVRHPQCEHEKREDPK